LRPALTWKARILLVRDVEPNQSVSYGRTFITPHPMRIASLAIGYADGFPRQASGCGAQVLVGGRRCPVLGRVTMDQILVDVTSLSQVAAGDEAVLIGEQGVEKILAKELAEKAGTISWDIFTGIGNRSRRFYF
jgi:alanine racemase